MWLYKDSKKVIKITLGYTNSSVITNTLSIINVRLESRTHLYISLEIISIF